MLFYMLSASIPPQIAFAEDSGNNTPDGFIDEHDDDTVRGSTRNEENGKSYERADVNKQVSFGDKPGEYFVDLEVTGKDNTKVETTDIVLVYDNSNSMER